MHTNLQAHILISPDLRLHPHLFEHFEIQLIRLFLCNQLTRYSLSYCIGHMLHTHTHTLAHMQCFILPSQHDDSVSSSFSFSKTFFLFTFFLWLYFCSVNRLLPVALHRLTVCVLDCANLLLYIAISQFVCLHLCLCCYTVFKQSFTALCFSQ